jgi:hypothetical protein
MSADAVPILITDPVSPLESLINVPIAAVQSVRQGFNFRWANAAARTAQTGMRAGDSGYQVDTGVDYRLVGSTWTEQNTQYTITPATGWTVATSSHIGLVNGELQGFIQLIRGTALAANTNEAAATLSGHPGAQIFFPAAGTGSSNPTGEVIQIASTGIVTVFTVTAHTTYSASI